jgi:hypothetical protein
VGHPGLHHTRNQYVVRVTTNNTTYTEPVVRWCPHAHESTCTLPRPRHISLPPSITVRFTLPPSTKNADVALPPLVAVSQQRHRLTPSPFATTDIDRGCCLPLLLTAGIALCHCRQRLPPSPFVTINKDCSCHPPMPSMETSSTALLTKTAVVALCRCFSRLLSKKTLQSSRCSLLLLPSIVTVSVGNN